LNVQFIARDSKKYAATGGWGLPTFTDGKPGDEALHKPASRVRSRLFHLVLESEGLGADSEEKREPVSDIDTVVADSLKVLDLKRPR
jgi:hypothetical protein